MLVTVSAGAAAYSCHTLSGVPPLCRPPDQAIMGRPLIMTGRAPTQDFCQCSIAPCVDGCAEGVPRPSSFQLSSIDVGGAFKVCLVPCNLLASKGIPEVFCCIFPKTRSTFCFPIYISFNLRFHFSFAVSQFFLQFRAFKTPFFRIFPYSLAFLCWLNFSYGKTA